MDKSKFSLLSNIKYPNDLRKLSINQLPEVCKELREDIIDEVAVNPGHFASSLGVVEITVALHYVYNTPEDRIVWDVGHQAYGHKILTGRREAFCTNRKLHGIRPFPTPLESEYDTFTCGHASNSISAALVGAVAVAGGAERQQLPDRLACCRQEIHKLKCRLAKAADPIRAGQTGYRHQNTTFTHDPLPSSLSIFGNIRCFLS